jgi:hypothetical protein
MVDAQIRARKAHVKPGVKCHDIYTVVAVVRADCGRAILAHFDAVQLRGLHSAHASIIKF